MHDCLLKRTNTSFLMNIDELSAHKPLRATSTHVRTAREMSDSSDNSNNVSNIQLLLFMQCSAQQLLLRLINRINIFNNRSEAK